MSYDVVLEHVPERPTAEVHAHLAVADLPAFFGPALGEVMAVVGNQGAQVTGAPFGRYHMTGSGEFDVVAGLPVDRAVAADGRVLPGTLPGGPVATTLHVGGYGEVAGAYEAVTAWAAEHGYVPAGDPWECYLDGPAVAEPRTEVLLPCEPG